MTGEMVLDECWQAKDEAIDFTGDLDVAERGGDAIVVLKVLWAAAGTEGRAQLT